MVSLNKGNFNEEQTFAAYNRENVFIINVNDIPSIISKIIEEGISDRILIQIPNTIGLTKELISVLPDNVDVRIIGGYTNEYGETYSNNNMDYMREKATYSKTELLEIIDAIETIEKGIDPSWNELEKAFYLYEYFKKNMVYRKTLELNKEENLNEPTGNTNRSRTWDSLIGLNNHLSVCNGFAHIYRELCIRQGIVCYQIGGQYITNKRTSHAWNIISINGKNILVDTIWDSIDYEHGINHTTGFGNRSGNSYYARCHKNLQDNLTYLNEEYIKELEEKIGTQVVQEINYRQVLEDYKRNYQADLQRMHELRKIQNTSIQASL